MNIRSQLRESAAVSERTRIGRDDWARFGDAIGRLRKEPSVEATGYGGNVVPLDQLREADASASAPAIRLAAVDRPAPLRPQKQGDRRLVLIALASLLAHAALYAASNLHRAPDAGIAEEAITVEIVVGSNSAAGTADARSETEVESRASAAAQQVEAADAPEAPRVEEKAAAAQSATAKAPDPAEPAPQPSAAPAEEPLQPVQKEINPTERQAEEPPLDAKPEDRPQTQPKPSTASAPAANSIGRGRMAGDANYQGVVAARLARFKQFPPDARRRRETGSAVVSFEIDGAGRVTSVRLVRRTGFAALDREAQAMVERASPFPAPPGGVAMSFSAPISFQLN